MGIRSYIGNLVSNPFPEKYIAPQDSAREACRAQLQEMWELEYRWVRREADRQYSIWRLIVFSQVGFEALAVVLAGVNVGMDMPLFARVALAACATLGLISSFLLRATKCREMTWLREQGRAEIRKIYLDGKQRFAEASKQGEYRELHLSLLESMDAVATQQGDQFFTAFASEGMRIRDRVIHEGGQASPEATEEDE